MLTVTLSHAPNPDIDGGYWQEGNSSARRHVIPVTCFEAASVMCRQYIERNGLGGGNWTGGSIERDGKKVAKVSYNGRIWDIEGKPICTS